jgi:hypothetical protein
MLKYNRLQHKMYSDTFFSNLPSVRRNKHGQLFLTDFGYMKFLPMKNKPEAGFALQELIKDVGISSHIHTHGAEELMMGKWRDICKDSNISTTQTERDNPWQNQTKVEI